MNLEKFKFQGQIITNDPSLNYNESCWLKEENSVKSLLEIILTGMNIVKYRPKN